MRKILLFIATSLDGFIAGPNGELDWLFVDQDYGYDSFLSRVDTVLMGRKTWDIVERLGPWPHGKMPGIVFSKGKLRATKGPIRFVAGDAIAEIRKLVKEPGKDLWLMGGGELVQQCLAHDLIDEFFMSLHPILLGNGIPLFPASFPQTPLRTLSVTEFDSGLIQVHYERR